MNTKTKKVLIFNKDIVINVLITLLLFLFIIIFAVNPSKYMNIFFSSLTIWGKSILPSLFPFLFFTKIITDLNIVPYISKYFKKIIQILFKAPSISAYIFLISILSGYPVGAKITSEFVQNGQLTKKSANKVLSFCSTSGPLFIIGTVGIGMFGNIKIGVIILISHILSSILNGIIFRKCYVDTNNLEEKKAYTFDNNYMQKSMYNSIISILQIGGFITIFSVIIGILNDTYILSPISKFVQFFTNIFSLPSASAKAITSGIIEITSGISSISKLHLSNTSICVLSSGLISFGGISVHLQSLAFLKDCKINKCFYFFQKFCHSIITMVLTFIICLIAF